MTAIPIGPPPRMRTASPFLKGLIFTACLDIVIKSQPPFLCFLYPTVSYHPTDSGSTNAETI